MARKLYIIPVLLTLLLSTCKEDENPQPTTESENFVFEAAAAERPIDLAPDDWRLVKSLSDQFNSTNVQAKWDHDPADWGPWSWEPDNVYQEDGILNLRLRYEEHSARNMDMFYKSGIIRSTDTITYGYVEAKIKGIPIYPTGSPALWLYTLGNELTAWGHKKNEEGSIHYAEVDIVELTQGEWDPNAQPGNPWDNRFPPERGDYNLHTLVYENGAVVSKRPGSHPELTENVYYSPWDPRDDFHTYGAEMTPEKITWYVDGIKVAEKENLHWHAPMHVTLSLGLRYPHVTYNNCPNGLDRCPVPSAATEDGFPTKMEVEWVRTYRRN